MSTLLGPGWTDVSGPTRSTGALFRSRTNGFTESNLAHSGTVYGTGPARRCMSRVPTSPAKSRSFK